MGKVVYLLIFISSLLWSQQTAQNFIRAATKDGSNLITWRYMSDEELTHFNIYRHVKPIDSRFAVSRAELIATLHGDVTQYLDIVPAEGSYYYAVLPTLANGKTIYTLEEGQNTLKTPIVVESISDIIRNATQVSDIRIEDETENITIGFESSNTLRPLVVIRSDQAIKSRADLYKNPPIAIIQDGETTFTDTTSEANPYFYSIHDAVLFQQKIVSVIPYENTLAAPVAPNNIASGFLADQSSQEEDIPEASSISEILLNTTPTSQVPSNSDQAPSSTIQVPSNSNQAPSISTQVPSSSAELPSIRENPTQEPSVPSELLSPEERTDALRNIPTQNGIVTFDQISPSAASGNTSTGLMPLVPSSNTNNDTSESVADGQISIPTYEEAPAISSLTQSPLPEASTPSSYPSTLPVLGSQKFVPDGTSALDTLSQQIEQRLFKMQRQNTVLNAPAPRILPPFSPASDESREVERIAMTEFSQQRYDDTRNALQALLDDPSFQESSYALNLLYFYLGQSEYFLGNYYAALDSFIRVQYGSLMHPATEQFIDLLLQDHGLDILRHIEN